MGNINKNASRDTARNETAGLLPNDIISDHWEMRLNQIYHGDNLAFMQDMRDESIDLIYIDPPFGTQSLWSSKAWKGQKVQEMAFYDSWGGGVNGYLEFMVERLRHMHRLLKPTGSLFVHLDWRMSHYVKVELDKIFGINNPCSKNTCFVNEIIWHYYNIACSSKSFLAKNHDTILWYSKKKKQVFNIDAVRQPYATNSNWVKNHKSYNDKYKPNKKGKKMSDVWDMPTINNMAKERLGWPTQKPLKLLQRIIEMSSNHGDIVADFFCGCGTAIDAAQSLNRQWIGIDASSTACEVMQKRMESRHSLFVGVNKKPTTYEEFKTMNPFDFEKAVVRHIGGVTNSIQVADGGVDGRLAFDGTPIQVKKDSKPVGDVDKFRSFYVHLKSHGRGIFISQEGYSRKAKERAAGWRNEDLDIQLLNLRDIVNGNYREQPIMKEAA